MCPFPRLNITPWRLHLWLPPPGRRTWNGASSFFFFFLKGKIEKKFCFQCLVCITDWLAQGGESFLQQLKKAGPWAEQ